MLKLAAQPGIVLSVISNASSRWDSSCIVLVDLGMPSFLPRLPFVARVFLAVISSWATWKRSWAGHDASQNKTAMERIVANIGIAV